jgi:hypothetical protein
MPGTQRVRLYVAMTIALVASSASGQATRVESVRLVLDPSGCAHGEQSLDVELIVTSDRGESRHSLAPSCRFAFVHDIELGGVHCHVESEMCGRFARRADLNARCSGGESSSATHVEHLTCGGGRN